MTRDEVDDRVAIAAFAVLLNDGRSQAEASELACDLRNELRLCPGDTLELFVVAATDTITGRHSELVSRLPIPGCHTVWAIPVAAMRREHQEYS